MTTQDAGSNWPAYFRAVRDRPPRELLLQALKLFDAQWPVQREPFAIDLGCGTGRDTIALLQQGWRVLAVDAQQEAIELLRQDALADTNARLETRVASFEVLADEVWPAADLINASFSLPFCHPQSFPALWDRIVTSLQPGGVFVGHLFGINDSWANNPERTFHSRVQVDALFTQFHIEFLREVEEDGTTATGVDKHWHVFSIITRKFGGG